MLVSQQRRNQENSYPSRPRQLKTQREPGEQRNHYDVHAASNQQRARDSELLRNGIESCGLVELHILARIQNVEPADPKSDRRAENQHAPIKRTANRDPGSSGRQTQTKTQHKM